MRTVCGTTIGCKVNQYDTNAIISLFEQAGFTKTTFDQGADVYIISTCTVTSVADKKSRQMLNRAKKKNPQAIVVAAGCLSQSEGEALKQKCNIDFVVGNVDRKKIVDMVCNQLDHQSSLITDIRNVSEFEELKINTSAEKTRAFIKIQEGCSNFCSYCIIPYVRGKERSRKPDNVVDEVKRLVKSGTAEIVLTGINVSSYGVDFDDDMDLITLMERLDTISELERLRLGSIEPMVIDEDFCIRAKQLRSFCPHFHLSLQSGCDSVLKRMNRKYTSKQYQERCLMLEKHFENPAITTDIIVGFPGETDQEFEKTIAFVKQIGFSKIHVFPYSIRKGTVAADMKDQIPHDVKKVRVNALMDIDAKLQSDFANRFLHQTVSVLFEEQDKQYPKFHVGYTKRYIKCLAKAQKNMIKHIHVNKVCDHVLYE